ncbi:MAG: ARMT1-like domain-containing protein [Desulfobacteraceae bacterium]
MEIYNDCVLCILRQSLEAARFVTGDEKIHRKILKQALKKMADFDAVATPPEMASHIQEIIRKTTGCHDPYQDVKKEYNDMALELLPGLKERVKNASSPMETALRLAIAGNIIDFGASSELGRQRVLDTIDHALNQEVYGDMDALVRALTSAGNILWLADNTGEIVFDCPALECIGPEKITFAVRGGPVLNDATLEDTAYTGISEMVKVIDNGTAIPGTIIDACSSSFKQAFDQADMIVAKGQGNYETLAHDDSRIFFLFKAKCKIVADLVRCRLGDMVVASNF